MFTEVRKAVLAKLNKGFRRRHILGGGPNVPILITKLLESGSSGGRRSMFGKEVLTIKLVNSFYSIIRPSLPRPTSMTFLKSRPTASLGFNKSTGCRKRQREREEVFL